MICRIKEITDKDLYACGGKGASLVRLSRAGLPVPDGYVITYDEDLSSVRHILPKLKGTYAVRSSALNEDSEGASFAGAYETLTDIPVQGIEEAIAQVRKSADNARVKAYSGRQGISSGGIAVVIQEFVKPEYAGVVFTSDPITGSSAYMTGNYVNGEGELLVSGVSDAKEFSFDVRNNTYAGEPEFQRYAIKLLRYCKRIKELWNMPTDIEWAVSNDKVYILQARPITTITRGDFERYELNGTCAGEFLMTRTNVGEIFGIPVSPVTYSIQSKICDAIAMPYFIDNVYGQAYLNVSVVASSIVALGFSERTALGMIKDIVGKLPKDVSVPIYPIRRKDILKKLLRLLRPRKKTKGMGLTYGSVIFSKIDALSTREELLAFWKDEMMPYIMTALSEVFKGMNISGLFTVRNKVEKLCGAELANRLLTGCTGIIDSMKPLLWLEDLADGRITKEEYIKTCGHRHANEMELMMPFPYEDPAFPDQRILEHKASGVNVHRMKEESEKAFEEALKEFDLQFPGKSSFIRKELKKYAKANADRESVRNKGVYIFCALRKYLLRIDDVLNLGKDEIFMLYMDEILELLGGNDRLREKIAPRKAMYEKCLSYPQFPNIIRGRFDPDSWVKDPDRRQDYFIAGMNVTEEFEDGIKGFPGASGIVTGKAHVITDIRDANLLKEGEILVTCATNIEWTIYFPKVSAIVTDIGAPLSHAAIVAREFGIPAVVGCGNATTLIHTGDLLTVNGAAGTVSFSDRSC